MSEFEWIDKPGNIDAEAERIARELESRAGYRVLREVRELDPIQSPGAKLLGLMTDTETTGIHRGKDKIIELCLVPFEYDREAGIITRIAKPYTSFQDPGVPIPEEITRITGIGDDHVKGKQIDRDLVRRWVGQVNVIVAHNAAFDRAFLEDYDPCFRDCNWVCSQSGLPWKDLGHGSSKLEFLIGRHGMFHGAHRAENDCFATLHILRQRPAPDQPTYFDLSIAHGRKRSIRVFAINAPFEAKDTIKAAGYLWNDPSKEDAIRGYPKAWWKEIPEENWAETAKWLAEAIYRRPNAMIRYHTVDAMSRFTERFIKAGTIALDAAYLPGQEPAPPKPEEKQTETPSFSPSSAG